MLSQIMRHTQQFSKSLIFLTNYGTKLAKYRQIISKKHEKEIDYFLIDNHDYICYRPFIVYTGKDF